MLPPLLDTRTVMGNSLALATSIACVTPAPPAAIAPKSRPNAGNSSHLAPPFLLGL